MEVAGVDEGKVATRFSFRIRNTGGPAGPETVPVAVETIGEDPEIVLEVPALEPGGVAELSFTRSLRTLRQPVRISVGDVVATVEVDARTADLQMGEVHWAIAGDGVTDLKVALSNEGSIAAQKVVVRAFSRPAVIDDGEASIAENSVVIDSLLPEARDTVTLPLTIPSGTHVVTLSAYTETMEAILDNNMGEQTVEVEYVRLRPAVESVEVGAYEADGDGVADVTIVVVNGGESASGPVEVGVVCQGESVERCGQSAVAESIPAGGRGEVSVELTIPQGETPVVVYAGAEEDGYRWGEENVQESVITIPEKAAVSFVLEAKVDVTGYWSNGMAEVMVTASLRNDGYEPIGESQVIAVECRQEGDTLNDCGGELSVGFDGGFGPNEGSLGLGVPMGSMLRVSLREESEEEGDDAAGVELEVPERILGVDRYIWECYSDRPALTSRLGELRRMDGCGGWYFGTVEKWELDRPLRVWATGHREYIRIFEVVLRYLPSLVNLQFEVVEDKEQADLEAYLGMPRSFGEEVPLRGCIDYGGCASHRNEFGVVKHGTIVVWQRRDALAATGDDIRHVILHELMHVVVPIGHRVAFDTRLATDSGLSVVDEQLIKFHSHPLIKAGMTMEEVEELIVLNEDLLDPQPLGPYQEVHKVVREAGRVVQEAESIRFQVKGRWRGGCGPWQVGPGIYELGEVEGASAGIVRYREGNDHYLIVDGSEHWREVNGRWEVTTGRAIFDKTLWAPTHPNPFTVLTSILGLGNDGNIEIVSRSGGTIVVRTSNPLSERVGYVTLVVDEETHQIEEYETMIRLRRGCQLVFGGENGEYGAEIELPDEVLQDR